MLSNMEYPESCDMPGKVSSVGVPHSLHITSSCCCSVDPGRKLRDVINSMNTQLEEQNMLTRIGHANIPFETTYPTDHMSISGPYEQEPNSNSGARYHKVTTLFESTLWLL